MSENNVESQTIWTFNNHPPTLTSFEYYPSIYIIQRPSIFSQVPTIPLIGTYHENDDQIGACSLYLSHSNTTHDETTDYGGRKAS